MTSQGVINLKLVVEWAWYKECGTFLMAPLLATTVCYFIPLFHGEQGMNTMAVLPFTAAFSYGHALSPRKSCYEKTWQKMMKYHEFVLANAKRALFFRGLNRGNGLANWSLLKGQCGRASNVFRDGYVGIFPYSFISYVEETVKLKKVDQMKCQSNLKKIMEMDLVSYYIFCISDDY